jgi:hypothetical protein
MHAGGTQPLFGWLLRCLCAALDWISVRLSLFVFSRFPRSAPFFARSSSRSGECTRVSRARFRALSIADAGGGGSCVVCVVLSGSIGAMAKPWLRFSAQYAWSTAAHEFGHQIGPSSQPPSVCSRFLSVSRHALRLLDL